MDNHRHRDHRQLLGEERRDAHQQRAQQAEDFFHRGLVKGLLFGLIFQNVSGLALQCLADRLEGRETDCLRLARLENREVGRGDVDALRKLRERHLAPGHHYVYVHYDGHQIVSFCSSIRS